MKIRRDNELLKASLSLWNQLNFNDFKERVKQNIARKRLKRSVTKEAKQRIIAALNKIEAYRSSLQNQQSSLEKLL